LAQAAIQPRSVNVDSPDQVIRGQLASGERLIWAGTPRQGILFRSIDLMCIPMGCAWCVGVALAVWLVLADGNWLFALGAAAFSLPGLYLAVGRAWIDAVMRRHTAYALTDRRVIFYRPLPRLLGTRIRSLSLSNITTVALRERRSGTGGTITFGAEPGEAAWLAANMLPGSEDYAIPMFELADHAREVYSLLLDTQQAAGHGKVSALPSVLGAAEPRSVKVLPLWKRQAIVAAVAAFGLAALLRWERWQCLDAHGVVLAESSGWLWNGQELDSPIAPRGGTVVEYRSFHFVPPLMQVRRQPVPSLFQPANSPAAQTDRRN
jgi:hypothetical protein